MKSHWKSIRAILKHGYKFTMGDTSNEDWDKFMAGAKFAKTLETHLAMSPQTVAALRSHGVKATDALKLEFFFLTNAEPKASALAAKGYAMCELGYKYDCDLMAGEQIQIKKTKA